MGNTGKHVCFSRIICSHCCTRQNLRFHVENCQHADQKQLTRQLAFDLDIEATYGQPGSRRARPVNVDDGLEDIRCIRGLGGEKLPAASYSLLPNLKKGLFLPSERDREFLSPVFYTAAPKCVCIKRLAGARHLSPVVFVNTVTRGWVGAPNERAPFRFHGAVLGFVDGSLSRTRNLAASTQHLAEFFSGRSWPKIRDREFLSPVFYTAAPKGVHIRRLAGARHVSPVIL